MPRETPDAVLDLRATRLQLVPGAFLVDGTRPAPLPRFAAAPAAP